MGDEYTNTLSYLCELFPEMDKDVVETVLNQNGNLPDPTVSALLNMNDPAFKPDQQDLSRQQELQRDAEYARRLQQREVAANNYRQRQQRYPSQRRQQPAAHGLSNTSNAPGPVPAGPLHGLSSTTNNKSDASHTKTSTKIRNIFRLGSSSSKRSNSNTPENNRPYYTRQQYGADDQLAVDTANRRTLDSDFGSSDGESMRASKTPELPSDTRPNVPVPVVAQDVRTDAQLARNPSGVFGHLDTTNDLSAAYTPLSPSKAIMATSSNTVSPVQTTAPMLPARTATVREQSSMTAASPVDIDLEHPFDTNPLLAGTTPVIDTLQQQQQQQQKEDPGVFSVDAGIMPSTNPFEQPPTQDTNPFRSRKNTL
ncbi:hypothetical protein H4R99_002581 [Coemansia sp. RSA 1722]|nr:hypothetical protein LPJ57_001231 [Coemansia sp. RSA 486]KAJ2235304.1 hypothetical protein IWW45_002719 [Coemansia sp. RSA 485]KAJ2602751.1 hypothetical protein H4R99_002581 [Coemansia sp. RSA 1722]